MTYLSGRKLYEAEDVTIRFDAGDDIVSIDMSGLAARRLMLGLGVQTRRYGPEVSALLTGLAKLLLGVPTSTIETANPHGRTCSCPHCKEAFQ